VRYRYYVLLSFMLVIAPHESPGTREVPPGAYGTSVRAVATTTDDCGDIDSYCATKRRGSGAS
jgi:hypothetical protein